MSGCPFGNVILAMLKPRGSGAVSGLLARHVVTADPDVVRLSRSLSQIEKIRHSLQT